MAKKEKYVEIYSCIIQVARVEFEDTHNAKYISV